MELLRCILGYGIFVVIAAVYWFGVAWSVKDADTSWWKAQTLPLFIFSATGAVLGLVYVAHLLLRGCCAN